jgi:hypothetical protein
VGEREGPLNEAQRPHLDGVRVALGTGSNPVKGELTLPKRTPGSTRRRRRRRSSRWCSAPSRSVGEPSCHARETSIQQRAPQEHSKRNTPSQP